MQASHMMLYTPHKSRNHTLKHTQRHTKRGKSARSRTHAKRPINHPVRPSSYHHQKTSLAQEHKRPPLQPASQSKHASKHKVSYFYSAQIYTHISTAHCDVDAERQWRRLLLLWAPCSCSDGKVFAIGKYLRLNAAMDTYTNIYTKTVYARGNRAHTQKIDSIIYSISPLGVWVAGVVDWRCSWMGM